jgi:hypothetical protein
LRAAAQALFQGASTFVVDIQQFGLWQGSALLAGQSSLAVDAIPRVAWQGSAVLVGGGGLVVSPVLRMPVSALLAGTAQLTALGSIASPIGAVFAGVGNLAAFVGLALPIGARWAGVGGLKPNAILDEVAGATLDGTSTFDCYTIQHGAVTTTLAGGAVVIAYANVIGVIGDVLFEGESGNRFVAVAAPKVVPNVRHLGGERSGHPIPVTMRRAGYLAANTTRGPISTRSVSPKRLKASR